ncbi:hypothetical protein STENM36S_07632 [Streptomyces tendae]
MGLPDAELRVELAAAQLVGCAMLRYVIKVEPLASADASRSSPAWHRSQAPHRPRKHVPTAYDETGVPHSGHPVPTPG